MLTEGNGKDTIRKDCDRLSVPRILFASPASGSGKTLITCGFLEILKRRKIAAVTFKCGPDYIDPLFHQYVLGIPGYNLDSFFLGREEIRRLFLDKFFLQDAEKSPVPDAGNLFFGDRIGERMTANIRQNRDNRMAVIEGVMGYYDGAAGTTVTGSSYEIAAFTESPVILIVNGKGASLSLAALIRGFLEYRSDSRICGVIFNRMSAAMEERLRPVVEELGVKVFGFVPECAQASLESRHLGLTLPGEQKRLREKIAAFADILEESLDVDGILALSRRYSACADGGIRDINDNGRTQMRKQGRIAVARDEAFCFYYQDNLDYLRELGYELIFFSPLHDRHLPEGILAVLLGGGYPERYAQHLSENGEMLRSIRESFGRIKILAECGGFLYLHQTLEGMDGKTYPMTGCLDAAGYRTEKLSRFGYIQLSCGIRAHEFHYWDSTAPGESFVAEKPFSERRWRCMYETEMLLAGFPHLYYRSKPEFIENFLKGQN
ncbi:MAG: cobyrinate a,c-diamide synthase [Clostridiales bacterium]|nr:cobyrinate a,c-diamide synthase [Clostridiales bacterium]